MLKLDLNEIKKIFKQNRLTLISRKLSDRTYLRLILHLGQNTLIRLSRLSFYVDNHHLKLQPYKISIFEESKQAGLSWDTLQPIQLVFSRQFKAKKRMPKYLPHEYN